MGRRGPAATFHSDAGGREYATDRKGNRITIEEAHRRLAISEGVSKYANRRVREDDGTFRPVPRGTVSVQLTYRAAGESDYNDPETITADWDSPEEDPEGAAEEAIAREIERFQKAHNLGTRENYAKGQGYIFEDLSDLDAVIEYE